jgi:hypothetical protein
MTMASSAEAAAGVSSGRHYLAEQGAERGLPGFGRAQP